MPEVQKPSVNRLVQYRDDAFPRDGEEPENWIAAMIVHVHSDTMVNLALWDANGNPSARTSVDLGTDEGKWRWPPRV